MSTPDTNDLILDIRDLHCHRGTGNKRAEILRGINLTIPRGGILAVLGANGAGKTTLINVLSTLLPASSGTVMINGHDLATNPAGIRSSISLTGQYAAIDQELTGRENLIYFGRLMGLSKSEATGRATELLTTFDLSAAADSKASDYSGGMRRRLDIAASLMVPPALLFLDEPTTGLDPAARRSVWQMIHALASDGTAILLTTQTLEEADALADRIAMLADGKVLDEGTPAELKDRYGATTCRIAMLDQDTAEQFTATLTERGFTAHSADGVVCVDAPDGYRTLVHALAEWTGDDNTIVDAGLVPATLDDVFFAIADSGDIARRGTETKEAGQ
ncbi:ATP-binding cassette domain-containing protein [Corynebacterium sp. TAE3-ERU12]|uniref:ATP-binding cassette domain-containing protein n=1 Tax=Corynebacterium sp. TAE3-ERU12 TaxID=2849491 RepID=UPI00210318A2|nr:ATP-binding cassette domain-containing protein [Corynebacterium sp. TAE3-ERU12]